MHGGREQTLCELRRRFWIVSGRTLVKTCVKCRRMNARRGPPKEMWSDTGTNFVGAERELRDAIAHWNEEKIESQLQQKGVKWIFQPPASPHMSGVWERIVKITKKHLKAIVGDGLLNDLELRTFLGEVEFIINSRPITAVPDDPTDLSALTRNHFLL